jgi:uncharacterized protein (DUF58 family)
MRTSLSLIWSVLLASTTRHLVFDPTCNETAICHNSSMETAAVRTQDGHIQHGGVSEPKIYLELRLRLPLVWLVALLFAAVILPDRIWNTLLVGLGGLFVISYFWARLLAGGLVAVRRLRFSWVSVGDRLEEEFALQNRSAVPALWVEIIDHSNVPGYRAGVVRSVAANGIDRWRQSSVCQRRGQYNLGPWSLISGDPFGIFLVKYDFPAGEEIIIHPPIHGRLPVTLPAGESSGRMRVQRRSWMTTINAASVRDYQPNDAHRLIHWPTSARRNSLYVRQFDQDAAGDVWLLLDLDASVQLGRGATGTEEHAVLLAAALAARALRQNRAVGLATYGRHPQVLLPARGQGHLWKILRALALVSADGEVDLRRALQDLSQTAKRGTTALIITPTASPDWIPELNTLARQGVPSNLILLDRPSFGGDTNNAGLAEAIEQQGFTSALIHQGEVGQPLEEQVRRGFWEFRVTATGKVIPIKSPWDARGPG